MYILEADTFVAEGKGSGRFWVGPLGLAGFRGGLRLTTGIVVQGLGGGSEERA